MYPKSGIFNIKKKQIFVTKISYFENLTQEKSIMRYLFPVTNQTKKQSHLYNKLYLKIIQLSHNAKEKGGKLTPRKLS